MIKRMIKRMMPVLSIKNKYIDRVYRFISPSYTTLEIDFEPEELELVKKAAGLVNQNIHQYVETAIRESMIREGIL